MPLVSIAPVTRPPQHLSSGKKSTERLSPPPSVPGGRPLRFGLQGRPVLSPAEKAAYQARQQAAESQRRALPLAVQFRHPLPGDRVTPRQMATLEAAMAGHPLFSDVDPSRFKRQEQAFLAQYASLNALLNHASSSLALILAQCVGLLNDPKVRDAIILKLLQHQDIRVSDRAAQEIDLLSDAKVRDTVLLTRLQSPDSTVRQKAAQSISLLSDAKVRDTLLLTLIKDPDTNVRIEAARSISLLLDPKVHETDLLTLLQDPESSVRVEIAKSVGLLSDPKLRDTLLLTLIQDPESRVKIEAAQYVYLLSDPKIRNATLSALLQDPDSSVRGKAAQSVSLINNPKNRDVTFLTLLKAQASNVKIEAAQSAGLINDPKLRDTLLLTLLKDQESSVRGRAVLEIGLLSDSQVRDAALLTLLQDPDSTVRWRAVQKIDLLSDPEVREATLLNLLQDPDNGVRQEAVQKIGLLCNPQVRDANLLTLIQDPHLSVRLKAIESIGLLSDSQVRDAALLALLQDPNNSVRWRATQKIDLLSDPEVREATLLTLLQDPDLSVRQESTQSISLLRDPQVRDANLLTLLQDPEPGVRLEAAQSIGLLCNPQVQNTALHTLLQAKASPVRQKAVQYLTQAYIESINRFGDEYPSYIAYLTEAMTDTSPLDVLTALSSLSGFADCRDGGELQTQVIPHYKALRQFIKVEANQNLHPGQEPYAETDLETLLDQHAAKLMKLLVIIGDAPLRTKATQGMDKFLRFLEATTPLEDHPSVFAQLRPLALRKDIHPYAVSQFLEVAAAFCTLGAVEILQGYLQDPALDLPTLGQGYLEVFTATLGLSASVSPDSLSQWNLPYMNILAEAYRGFAPNAQGTLKAVIEATLTNGFDAYCRDPETAIGQANAQTAETFRENGLNMDTWLQYNRVKTFTLETSTEPVRTGSALESLRAEFSGEILKLMGSRKKSLPALLPLETVKALFQHLKGQGYALDSNLTLSSNRPEGLKGERLSLLSQSILSFLEEKGVWATEDSSLLTLKSHLEQLVPAFQNSNDPTPQAQGFRIKTWDRNPGYDLFQGNYTQCCIALDQTNRSAILDYLTSHGVQLVEVQALGSDKTMANTFLYWGKTPQGDLSLVVDNVEVAAQYRDARTATRLREELAAYLKDYAQAVIGREAPILLGQNYNDIPTLGLPETEKTLQVMAYPPDGELYLDSLHGNAWINIQKPCKAKFYILN